MTWEVCDIGEHSSQIIWVQLFAIWTSRAFAEWAGPFPEPRQLLWRAASFFFQGLLPTASVLDHFFFRYLPTVSQVNLYLLLPLSATHPPTLIVSCESIYSGVKYISKVVTGCVAKGVLTRIRCLYLYSIMADQYHALSFQDVGFTKTSLLEAGKNPLWPIPMPN